MKIHPHTLRYAGIGPRDTPAEMLEVMVNIAQQLSGSNWWLSSGWGKGADQAFSAGAPSNQQTQWIPWKGFNGAYDGLPFKIPHWSTATFNIAEQYHPYWGNMKERTQLLMARNVAILLGDTFEQIVDLVIYWQSEEDESSLTSGTNHTRRIALAHEIPQFNIRIESERNALCKLVEALEAGL